MRRRNNIRKNSASKIHAHHRVVSWIIYSFVIGNDAPLPVQQVNEFVRIFPKASQPTEAGEQRRARLESDRLRHASQVRSMWNRCVFPQNCKLHLNGCAEIVPFQISIICSKTSNGLQRNRMGRPNNHSHFNAGSLQRLPSTRCIMINKIHLFVTMLDFSQLGNTSYKQ